MTTGNPEPPAVDPTQVRLAWPGGPRDEEDASFAPPRAESERPLVSEPRRPSREAAIAVVESDLPGASALRRAIVDAYDRLADRVLNRLRSVHDDVNADMADIRSDVAALRDAVEDLGDRVQLRALRAQIDELRSDVAGMRRMVLEWPELERVSGDITALRADFTDVLEGISAIADSTGLTSGRSGVKPLVEEIEALRAELPELRTAVEAQAKRPDWQAAMLAPLVEEIEALRKDIPSMEQVEERLTELHNELQSLRRRIPLRAGAPRSKQTGSQG